MRKRVFLFGGLFLIAEAIVFSISAYSIYRNYSPYYYGYQYNCSNHYSPVCGTDNKTYNNACRAREAGVNIQYYGICHIQTYSTYSRPYFYYPSIQYYNYQYRPTPYIRSFFRNYQPFYYQYWY